MDKRTSTGLSKGTLHVKKIEQIFEGAFMVKPFTSNAKISPIASTVGTKLEVAIKEHIKSCSKCTMMQNRCWKIVSKEKNKKPYQSEKSS